jgi:hypothetical protein
MELPLLKDKVSAETTAWLTNLWIFNLELPLKSTQKHDEPGRPKPRLLLLVGCRWCRGVILACSRIIALVPHGDWYWRNAPLLVFSSLLLWHSLQLTFLLTRHRSIITT